MVLPLWRSLHSLNLMLPKEDRKAMLLRLYNEDTPLMDHSKDRFHDKPEPQANADIVSEHGDIKNEEDEEEEVDADVKKEKAALKEEGTGESFAAAGSDGDVEMTGNGAGDEAAAEGEDDVLSDAVQAEVEDGV